MPIPGPRSKTVIFRVTPEEYERLKAAAASSGARNLSDFTRSGVLSIAEGGSVLEQGLSEIDRKLDAILEIVQESGAPEKAEPPLESDTPCE